MGNDRKVSCKQKGMKSWGGTELGFVDETVPLWAVRKHPTATQIEVKRKLEELVRSTLEEMERKHG